MAAPPNGTSPVVEIRDEELASLLERISGSGHFLRSRRLQGFLRYVCQCARENRINEITEQQIGHRVFGRAADYNPGEDNIVRVEARELRKRLEAYFGNEGADEHVLIEIPKGSYVPRLVPRPAIAPEAAVVPVETAARRNWLVWALGGLSVVLAGVCLWLWIGGRPAAPAGGFAADPLHQFWARVFRTGEPAILTVADSSFALLQDVKRVSVPFQDYVSGRFIASLRAGAQAGEAERTVAQIASRHYTSLADAALISRIVPLKPPGAGVVLRFARELKADDVKSSNIVFFGSERSNPWSGLFDSWRNFRSEYDIGLQRSLIRNKKPRPGEPETFVGGPVGEKPYDAHGVIGFLPNLDRTGVVVIIAGTNMQGTEAAGEFLTNPQKFDQLMKAIGAERGKPLPYFEVVLKLIAVDASSLSTEIVAHRLVDAQKLEAIRYTER